MPWRVQRLLAAHRRQSFVQADVRYPILFISSFVILLRAVASGDSFARENSLPAVLAGRSASSLVYLRLQRLQLTV